MLGRRGAQAQSFGDYLTVGEAAEFLGVSASTLRNWDRAGKLRPVRHPMNDYRLYRRSELEGVLGTLVPGRSRRARKQERQ